MKNFLSNLKNMKLDSDKKNILIVFIFLIIVFLDCSVILKFQHQGIRNLEPKIKKVKQDLDNLNRDLVNMQNIKAKQASIDKGASKIKRVISKDQMTLLLENISDMANKNGVKILQMTPTNELSQSKIAITRKPQGSGLAFFSQSQATLTLDLICEYHQLGKFINDLENAEFYIDVESIKIMPWQGEILKQRVNLVVRMYVEE